MLCAFEIDPVNLISLTAFLMQGEETPDRVERIISKANTPAYTNIQGGDEKWQSRKKSG